MLKTYTTLVCQKSPSVVQKLNIKVKFHLRNPGNAEQSSYSNVSSLVISKTNVMFTCFKTFCIKKIGSWCDTSTLSIVWLKKTDHLGDRSPENLTKDELYALRRLRNDKAIVILPAAKGRVTVVMDKKDYTDKMDSLVNDTQTYEPLKRDPTPALQGRLNGKQLNLKKTFRLRCRVPQSA